MGDALFILLLGIVGDWLCMKLPGGKKQGEATKRGRKCERDHQ